MTVEESGLRFEFDPKAWRIRKYDQHTYYQGLSSVGLKAMDFIGLLYNTSLVLIEVKNYCIGENPIRRKEVEESLSRPDAIIESLAQKADDTLIAIDAVQQSYQRNWYYRRFINWHLRWSRSDTDWKFWTNAHVLMQEDTNIILLYWLEADPEHRKVMNRIAEGVYKHPDLAAWQVLVGNTGTNPFLPNLHVTPLDSK